MDLEELKNYLIQLNVNSLRMRLAEDEQKIKNLSQILIDEFFSSSLIDRSQATNCQRKNISYVIVDYFRSQPNFETLLDQALYAAVIKTADCIVVDVLMQSGANIFQIVHTDDKDKMLYNVVRYDIRNDQLFEVIDKYFPSLLHAIEGEDIKQVRRLINYWCATDVRRCGKTVQEIAISSGNEEIIRLISGVEYTMKLVHYILAGNANSVERLLNEHCNKIKLDFRNMSDKGAPILYYAIKSNNVKIIQLLMEKGCKLFSLMRFDSNSDVEIPVFFSALINPHLPPAIMQALLSQHKPGLEDILYQMTYKSKNALEVAIQYDLNLESFQILIDRCGPKLIADRNENCLTARDFAIKVNKPCYASIIDDYVSKCVSNISSYKHHIQTFSLWGYDFSNLEKNQHNLEFLEKAKVYQTQIASLSKCIEEGNPQKFYLFIQWKHSSEDEIFQKLLCWDGRNGKLDPLPLLHKAVIFNRPKIVNAIIAHMPRDQSIDTLLDIYRRTAMHYAYASIRFAEIRKIFRFAGSSDHSLDRFGKEPLDFKDKQYHHLMPKLLYRLRKKQFDEVEPNVWSENEMINVDSKVGHYSLCFLS